MKKIRLSVTLALAIFISLSSTLMAKDVDMIMEKVKFPANGVELTAHLYFPVGFDKSIKYPAIVSVPSAGAVKEQTSGLYARRLMRK